MATSPLDMWSQITPGLLRSARSLLGWSRSRLASECGIGLWMINNIEQHYKFPSQPIRRRIVEVLYQHGVRLLNGPTEMGVIMTKPDESISLLANVPMGWHRLIQPLIDRCKKHGVFIDQIKEKYGGLRFYVGSCSDQLQADIHEAERLSLFTCCECGSPGTLRNRGHVVVLCDLHASIQDIHTTRPTSSSKVDR